MLTHSPLPSLWSCLMTFTPRAEKAHEATQGRVTVPLPTWGKEPQKCVGGYHTRTILSALEGRVHPFCAGRAVPSSTGSIRLGGSWDPSPGAALAEGWGQLTSSWHWPEGEEEQNRRELLQPLDMGKWGLG